MYRTFLFVAPFVCMAVYGQNVPACVASANPPVVRAEGISERTGDVAFSCTGGQPNATVTGNLSVFLSVNVTNHILPDGTADVLLTVNGAPANVPARVTGANQVTWNGLTFPLNAQGAVELRLINLRGNASQLIQLPGRQITLFASFTGGSILTFTTNAFSVGVPLRALLAGSSGRLICTQAGSPLPSSLTLSSLLAGGTVYSSTRVTEGFATAFAPRTDWSNLNADSGVRIIATYGGFPAGARLFAPDAVAGSNADAPTSAGDLGLPASGGAYTPGRGQLLLVRVTGADASGAGGRPAFPAPDAPATFNTVSEVPLVNGAGTLVYEVVDASPVLRESAQFPVFLGLPSGGPTATTTWSVNLAPVSSVFTAAAAPVPRFISIVPEQDCTALGDCNAPYFPRLDVGSSGLKLNNGSETTGYIPIRNTGSGILGWTATTTAPYLRLSPSAGVNNGTVRVDVLTQGLAAGSYTASVVIDAGPLAGSRTVPVTVLVGQSDAQPPLARIAGNAADGSITALVPGSLATIYGSRFGKSPVVTFDGTPATVLFASDTQINVEVPATLAGKTSAQIRVTADGVAGQPLTADIAASAPAIFPGAVLNADWSANSESRPAAAGSALQIFATGLPVSGPITAKIHDREVLLPDYAGRAPGLTGLQQVNIAVPSDLPAMQTYVYVCGNGICSPAVKVWLGR